MIPFFHTKRVSKYFLFHFRKNKNSHSNNLLKKRHVKSTQCSISMFNQLKGYMKTLLLIEYEVKGSKTVDVFFFFNKLKTFFRIYEVNIECFHLVFSLYSIDLPMSCSESNLRVFNVFFFTMQYFGR